MRLNTKKPIKTARKFEIWRKDRLDCSWSPTLLLLIITALGANALSQLLTAVIFLSKVNLGWDSWAFNGGTILFFLLIGWAAKSRYFAACLALFAFSLIFNTSFIATAPGTLRTALMWYLSLGAMPIFAYAIIRCLQPLAQALPEVET